jgi:hypothetical protein
MNVIFLPAAQEEFAATAAYLDDRAAGLGAEFVGSSPSRATGCSPP